MSCAAVLFSTAWHSASLQLPVPVNTKNTFSFLVGRSVGRQERLGLCGIALFTVCVFQIINNLNFCSRRTRNNIKYVQFRSMCHDGSMKGLQSKGNAVEGGFTSALITWQCNCPYVHLCTKSLNYSNSASQDLTT